MKNFGMIGTGDSWVRVYVLDCGDVQFTTDYGPADGFIDVRFDEGVVATTAEHAFDGEKRRAANHLVKTGVLEWGENICGQKMLVFA